MKYVWVSTVNKLYGQIGISSGLHQDNGRKQVEDEDTKFEQSFQNGQIEDETFRTFAFYSDTER